MPNSLPGTATLNTTLQCTNAVVLHSRESALRYIFNPLITCLLSSHGHYQTPYVHVMSMHVKGMCIPREYYLYTQRILFVYPENTICTPMEYYLYTQSILFLHILGIIQVLVCTPWEDRVNRIRKAWLAWTT